MLLLQRIAFLAETGLNTDAATGNTTITNVLGWAGGIIAFQSLDSAEIQLGGDAYDYPCARQFLVRRPL